MTMSKMAKQYMKDKLDDMYQAGTKGETGALYDMIIELKEMIDNE